jgi:mannose-1-phosphate guanylyltransferase/mannose-6-phosphate isomerase
MSEPAIKPVILCGGAGTRLWPLSREALPKQFAPLIGGKSLLQATLERVAPLGPALCISNQEHRFFVQEALQLAQVNGEQLLEPAGRNTGAAMACAALIPPAEQLLLFLPADHYIPDAETFLSTVRSGEAVALAGAIVTFGVSPTFPSTAYGYIQQGDVLADGHAHKVKRFLEKPKAEVAQQLLLSGDHLWNAGIFLCTASTLKAALQAHAPDILAACELAMSSATRDGSFIRPGTEAFLSCRSESIDYAVMEHFEQVAVVPFVGQWSDVGSWNAVAELTPPDAQGNRVEGQAVLLEATDTYINASSRPVVAIGTQNLLIVDTADALLVVAKDHAERVKQAVEQLKNDGFPQATTHRRVARPWGWYDSIDMGERFQVKRIGVNPGASLSLQMHHHRAEHWVVVKGTAEVTNGDKIMLIAENESTYIPLGVKHRLRNPGKTALEIIEVQSGSYLGEDDIVRFEDTYGRTSAGK